jgi:hypothetical protein
MLAWSFLFVSVAGTQKTCNSDSLIPVSVSYKLNKNEVLPVPDSNENAEGYRQNKAVIIGVIIGVLVLIAVLK